MTVESMLLPVGAVQYTLKNKIGIGMNLNVLQSYLVLRITDYLSQRHFTIYIDNAAMKWLIDKKRAYW